MDITILILCVLILVILALNLLHTARAAKSGNADNLKEIQESLNKLEIFSTRSEAQQKDEFARIREELGRNLQNTREELSRTLNDFSDSILKRMSENSTLQTNQFNSFAGQLGELTKSNEEKLTTLTEKLDSRLSEFREQINSNSKENREESAKSLKSFEEKFEENISDFNDIQKQKFDEMTKAQNELIKITEDKLDQMKESAAQNLEKTNKLIEDKLNNFQRQLSETSKENRDELSLSLKSFEESFKGSVEEFNEVQKDKFDALSAKQAEQNQSMEKNLDKIRGEVESKLDNIREDNNKKLEQMRETVDEKLHKTLEERLGQSFRLVSKQLESVHEGLGEMKKLATGVGDLKKVLSNVKTKGVLGEYQLENILEQILSPEQYSKNVKTKERSSNFVEFAIKLPGKGDADKPVWLPLDSKFPTEDYNMLIDAYDKAETDLIEKAKKNLADKIIRFAKDISSKYIDPPNTTDFAIMFLPIEGLYAEVLQNVNLFEVLQRDYKIIITGPTTLSALLNSLQMGFRTLAIEKRSSEVWKVLGAVKKEFGKFGTVLEKAQDKIQKAGKDLDQLVGTRTRAIERQLKGVEELPEKDPLPILDEKIVEKAVSNDELF